MANFRGGRDAIVRLVPGSVRADRSTSSGRVHKAYRSRKMPSIPQGERVEANTLRRTTPKEQHWRWRAGCDKRTHHATFQTANQVAMI